MINTKKLSTFKFDKKLITIHMKVKSVDTGYYNQVYIPKTVILLKNKPRNDQTAILQYFMMITFSILKSIKSKNKMLSIMHKKLKERQ